MLQSTDALDEFPDLYCIDAKFVRLTRGENEYKVHFHCFRQFQSFNHCVVRGYIEQTQHLLVTVPIRYCAHCGESVVRQCRARDCDTCLFLFGN